MSIMKAEIICINSIAGKPCPDGHIGMNKGKLKERE
jgi:hypothetical protein